MKVNTVQREIHSHGVKESRKATIQASGKAFEILSSGLYADKIKAVIRELATNAYDAQVEAGNKDKPFDVKLPTMLDPVFRIRDYGTGLSHDDVLNLYNTYFQSTKTNSNDAIGALGLGSKSPYSYTSVFTVVSYFEGMKRVYNSGLDAEGCPSCSFVHEEETTEPNGLEVSFGVKKNDFTEFNTKAALVYRRFNPLPNVTGADEYNYIPELSKTIMSGKDWRVFDVGGGHYSYYANQYAVMGLIEYPINIDSITGNNAKSGNGISKAAADIFPRLNIELNFDIGDLDIAASREELGYSVYTSQALIERINRVIEEITNKYKDDILSAKTYKEACNKYADLSNIGHLVAGNITIKYKGKTVNKSINSNFGDIIAPMFKESIPDGEPNAERRNKTISTYNEKIRERLKGTEFSIKTYFKYNNRLNKAVSEWDTNNIHKNPYSRNKFDISTRDNNIVLINDLNDRTVTRRIRYHLDTNSNTKHVYLITIDDNEARKLFLDFIDYGEYKNVSEFPDEPKSARIKHQALRGLYKYRYPTISPHDCENTVKRQWMKITSLDNFDDSETFYYVPVNRYIVTDETRSYNPREFRDMLAVAKSLGYNKDVIYGVPASAVSLLKGLNGTWINLLEDMKTKVKSYLGDNDFLSRIRTKNIRRLIGNSIEVDKPFLCAIYGYLDTGYGDALINYISKVKHTESMRGETHEDNQIKAAMDLFGIELTDDSQIEFEKIKELHANIFKVYPMIGDSKYIDYIVYHSPKNNDLDGAAKRMAEYIKIMDDMSNKKSLAA